jgi:allantoin racemase
MHALLINPNTSQHVTERLVAQLQPWCEGLPLMGVTAPFGEAYIASEAAYTVAGHAVLEAFEHHVDEHGLPQAVLVGCFGDPAVWALRVKHPTLPVIGLAEAALREAHVHGPFAVVTGGHAWGPMIERLAATWHLLGPQALLRVHTLDATGGQMLADPDAAVLALGEACEATLQACPSARSIVLGGAALGGMAADLAPRVGLPLIDNVQAGGRWLSRALAH